MTVPVGAPSAAARRLSALLEPVIGQVYFAPECHANYAALGFDPSPSGPVEVARPDGPAYFTSRGSVMGQVSGQVVAAAFAVFNPAVVVPCVDRGWSLTDAATICAARDAGARAQLVRVLGVQDAAFARAATLLERAGDPIRIEGRPLAAGVRALGRPEGVVERLFRAGDFLREARGDAHTVAWVAAGFDPIEIGLLTEQFWGMPPRGFIFTRGWSVEQVDAAAERLRSRGLFEGDVLTGDGRVAREAVEAHTDVLMTPAVAALGDDLDELCDLLRPWGDALRAALAYPAPGGRRPR